MSLTDEEVHSKLYQELKKCLPLQVRYDAEIERRNNAILRKVVETLMDKICEVDSLFKLLYQRIYYTGSYYEGLRIQCPNEFDLNIVLKLPFKENDRKLFFLDPQPSLPGGYATVELVRPLLSILEYKKNWIAPNVFKVFSKFFYDDQLDPGKIRCWLQSCVDRAYNFLGFIQGVREIRRSQHGPSKQLQIILEDGGLIDVDLVPVIQINWPEWPYQARTEPADLVNDSRYLFWFLVPKPSNIPRVWRIHFPEIERQVIYNKGCVKPLIKLLKLLRDSQGWKSLASYYLKTVLLWEVEEHPSTYYWTENQMGKLFIEVLKKLQNYLKNGHLPNYFYPQCSLIADIDPLEREKIANRIHRILNTIKKDPSSILKFLATKNHENHGMSYIEDANSSDINNQQQNSWCVVL